MVPAASTDRRRWPYGRLDKRPSPLERWTRSRTEANAKPSEYNDRQKAALARETEQEKVQKWRNFMEVREGIKKRKTHLPGL